jgi:hypothetical protein
MTDFDNFLKDSVTLAEKVDGYSQALNSQGEGLNDLINRLAACL